MSLDPSDFFDPETLAALRSIRRDRKLTIAAGARPWIVPGNDSEGLPAHFIACIDVGNNGVLAGSPALPDERDEAIVTLLLKAILDPDQGSPRLPRRVIVEDQAIAKAIEPSLRRVG